MTIKSIDITAHTHPDIEPWIHINVFNQDTEIIYSAQHPITDLPRLQAAQRGLMAKGIKLWSDTDGLEARR